MKMEDGQLVWFLSAWAPQTGHFRMWTMFIADLLKARSILPEHLSLWLTQGLNIWLWTLLILSAISPLNISIYHFPICYSQLSETGVQNVQPLISSMECSWELNIIYLLAHKA